MLIKEAGIRMSVRVLLAALVSGVLLLLSPVALAAGPYPPPSDGGSGEVSETRIEAGECMTFTGSGFAPSTEVTIRDNGEFVGTARTDSDGVFAYEYCADADVRTGRHTLTGTGLGSDGQLLTVHATFYVTGVSQRPGGGSTGGGSTGGTSAGSGGQPSATPTHPGAKATPTPPSGSGVVPGGNGAIGKNDDKGLSGLATAAITISVLLLLALLAALLLLLEKRRRERAAEDLPL
jgi:hypothetical protein